MSSHASQPPRIGLIGLGLMGRGIGRNLLKNGFPLTVVGHRNRAPVDSLVGLGATDAGQTVIDCSTSDPRSSVGIQRDLQAAGVTFVDAPLGRTPKEAEAGKLNVMVGATPEVLESIRPVLTAFAENVIHVGEALSAQMLKLVNNYVVVGTVALITEALRTCDRIGVEREALHGLMSKGPLAGPLLQMTAGQILEGRRDGMKFSICNAHKDIGYFAGMAQGRGEASSMSGDLIEVLAEALRQGLGERLLPSLVDLGAPGESRSHKPSETS